MDIRELKYFLQVMRDQNITKAADNLFITQPALSKTIKKLESELGVDLLVKTSKGSIPTNSGIQVAEFAAPLVNAFSQMEEQLQALLNAKKSAVTIGVGPTFGFSYINAIISKFHEVYPNIDVSLRVDSAQNICTKLKNYELDICIFNEHQYTKELSSLNHITLHKDEMVIVCNKNHPLARREKLSLQDFANEEFNLCSNDFALYDMSISAFHEAGFDPKINFICNSFEILLDMTAAGNGICFLPRPYVERILVCFPNNTTLHLDPPVPWVLYLATVQNAYQSYSTITFSNFIQKYFEDYQKNLH